MIAIAGPGFDRFRQKERSMRERRQRARIGAGQAHAPRCSMARGAGGLSSGPGRSFAKPRS